MGEKVAEGVAEKTLGDDVDLDLDGDKVTIKGDDGNFYLEKIEELGAACRK